MNKNGNTVTQSTRTVQWPGKGEVVVTTYRCSSCQTGVTATHVPDSSDCDETYREKMDSYRD